MLLVTFSVRRGQSIKHVDYVISILVLKFSQFIMCSVVSIALSGEEIGRRWIWRDLRGSRFGDTRSCGNEARVDETAEESITNGSWRS